MCGSAVIVAGDSNADPGIIPCLAKGISAGRFVDYTFGLFDWCGEGT